MRSLLYATLLPLVLFCPLLRAQVPFANPGQARLTFDEAYIEVTDREGNPLPTSKINLLGSGFSRSAPSEEYQTLDIDQNTLVSISLGSGRTILSNESTGFETFVNGKATFGVYSPSGTDVDEDGFPDRVATVTLKWTSNTVGFDVLFDNYTTEFFVAADQYSGQFGSVAESTLDALILIGDRAMDRKIYYTGTVGPNSKGLSNVHLTGVFDVTPPVLVLDRPSATGGTVYYPSVDIGGSVSDLQSGPGKVLVQVNDNPQQEIDVQFVENWDYPDDTLLLKPGLNTISAQAFDLDGNASAWVSSKVTYATKSPLIVKTGSGSGKTSITGTTLQTTGSDVTITATPAEGWVFVNWQGNLGKTAAGVLHGEPIPAAQASQPTITFPMLPHASLEAVFKPSPFFPLKGQYDGTLICVPKPGLGGSFQLTLSAGGNFTGKIITPGGTYTLQGEFNTFNPSMGTATFSGTASGGLGLTLDLDLNGNKTVSGTVTFPDGSLASIQSDQWDKTRLTNWTGAYTFLLPTPVEGDPTCPQGTGYGTAIINSTGAVRITGVLPDKTRFAFSSFLNQNDGFRFLIPLYPNRAGVLSGEVALENVAAISDFQGVLNWYKPVTSGSFYPGTFSFPLAIIGSKYDRTPANNMSVQPLFGGGSARIAIFAASSDPLMVSSTTSLLAPARNRYTAPSSTRFGFAVNAYSGLMMGSFLNGKVLTSFRGAVLQKQSLGAGLFSNRTQTGAVLIGTPNNPAPEIQTGLDR